MPKKIKQGTVVSNKMDKAIVVKVTEHEAHSKYKKIMQKSKNYKVCDLNNECNVGDVVEIVENKPISKSICWTLSKVVTKAN